MFKECKSYANLHKFDMASEHIAAGLIWASLCAAVLKRFLARAAQFVGGKPISTRRVAMCAGHIIDEIAIVVDPTSTAPPAITHRSGPPICFAISVQLPSFPISTVLGSMTVPVGAFEKQTLTRPLP